MMEDFFPIFLVVAILSWSYFFMLALQALLPPPVSEEANPSKRERSEHSGKGLEKSRPKNRRRPVRPQEGRERERGLRPQLNRLVTIVLRRLGLEKAFQRKFSISLGVCLLALAIWSWLLVAVGSSIIMYAYHRFQASVLSERSFFVLLMFILLVIGQFLKALLRGFMWGAYGVAGGAIICCFSVIYLTAAGGWLSAPEGYLLAVIWLAAAGWLGRKIRSYSGAADPP